MNEPIAPSVAVPAVREPSEQVHAALALLKRIRYHAERHSLPPDWLTAADEVLGTFGKPVLLTRPEITQGSAGIASCGRWNSENDGVRNEFKCEKHRAAGSVPAVEGREPSATEQAAFDTWWSSHPIRNHEITAEDVWASWQARADLSPAPAERGDAT